MLHALANFASIHARWGKVDEAETTKCFRLVLKTGANVHQVDFKGYTLLHQAQDVVCVRCLLEGGADPNAVTTEGKTLLHISFSNEILSLSEMRRYQPKDNVSRSYTTSDQAGRYTWKR